MSFCVPFPVSVLCWKHLYMFRFFFFFFGSDFLLFLLIIVRISFHLMMSRKCLILNVNNFCGQNKKREATLSSIIAFGKCWLSAPSGSWDCCVFQGYSVCECCNVVWVFPNSFASVTDNWRCACVCLCQLVMITITFLFSWLISSFFNTLFFFFCCM